MQPAAILDHIDELEARLRDLQEMLHQSDRLATVGTLAAGVAHEVNNQLTPALAYAQILRSAQHERTPLESKAIDRVIESIESATRIMSSILNLAAPPSSDQPATVARAVDRAVECLGEPLSRQHIELVSDIPNALCVAAPDHALQQIMLNLLLNARRALKSKGRGTIRITAQKLEREAEIQMEDDGPGVPPAIRDRLFEPFVSAAQPSEESSRPSPAHCGYGLGLAVCRRLTDQLGGRITAEHPESGGALFRIRLPLPVAADPAQPSCAASGTT